MRKKIKKFTRKKIKKGTVFLEQGAFVVINKIGSLGSIIIHSIIFVIFFLLGISGWDWNTLLLVLTTIVSLEAIYLAIFIQMTVNENTQSLAEVEEDIDEIQKDIDDIQEDVDDIAEDEKEAETHDREQLKTMAQIQEELQQLAKTIASLRVAPKKKK